jgi:hypothetical protein
VVSLRPAVVGILAADQLQAARVPIENKNIL